MVVVKGVLLKDVQKPNLVAQGIVVAMGEVEDAKQRAVINWTKVGATVRHMEEGEKCAVVTLAAKSLL